MADKNLFPVFDVPEIAEPTQVENRRYKPSVFFDFEAGDFRLDGAYRMTPSTGKEAYMQWCRKAVMTERDAALAESDRAAVESALEKTITEALMVNTHTEYVRDFEFAWSADELRLTFTVKGKEWEQTTISVLYQNSN